MMGALQLMSSFPHSPSKPDSFPTSSREIVAGIGRLVLVGCFRPNYLYGSNQDTMQNCGECRYGAVSPNSRALWAL